MGSQVLLYRWGRLLGETEIVLTEKPNAAVLTVVFRVRNLELRRLKLFPTAVTTWLNHLGLRVTTAVHSILYGRKPGPFINLSRFSCHCAG
jgi:hypothetical protein